MAEISLAQQAYTHIQQHFIASGRAPHFAELAAALGINVEEARRVQREAAEAGVGCWISHDTDYIASWAPFSNIPTQYLVTVAGEQKWYAQCGLEALAVRWLFPGQEVRIEANCLDCGEPIAIRMKDDELLDANGEAIVGHITFPVSKWREVSNALL
jgi:hypothetical protein